METCEQREFVISSVKGRGIKARFDGGQISSDGGLLLLKEADRELGLSGEVAAVIPEERQRGKIRHRVRAIVQQSLFGLTSGYEDLNDFEGLREDTLWQTVCGSDMPLAGKSTLSRFALKHSRAVAVGINRILVEQFIASFKQEPAELILDFDATDDRVHGQEEGRFFHGYYGDYCFRPLYVFCGQKLICAYVRRANVDVATHSAAILKLLVTRFRLQWPQVRILFRADSGFCRDRTLTWCDRTSSTRWWSNQWRMLLSALAYTLIEHIRSKALEGTELARAQCQHIRLKLFKIGAVVVRTRRMVRIHLSQAYPFQALFAQVYYRLRLG